MTNDEVISCVENAFSVAHRYGSKIPKAIVEMDGMSGLKFRHFLNQLFENLGVARKAPTKYLEIGSWRGSTFCSSIYGNHIDAFSIDDFSEFKDLFFTGVPKSTLTSKERLMENVTNTVNWSPANYINAKSIDQDCWTVAPADLPHKADVFFYDGEHSFNSQYRVFTHFNAALEDQCLIVVDDYEAVLPNAPREATQKAFRDLGYTVVRDWHNKEGDGGIVDGRKFWWNGVYVALINKTNK